MDLKRAYSILKITPHASEQEIKKAFRKLAFSYHPDLNPNLKNAEKKFQELNEAYVFLLKHIKSADKEKHKTYYTGYSVYEKHTRDYNRAKYKTHTSRIYKRKQFHTKKHYNNSYVKEEEILKNILNDPFARQVFEDIFREVKRKSAYNKTLNLTSHSIYSNKSIFKDKLSKFKLNNIKKWLRSQLDHEHIIYLDKNKIIPGAKLKFQLKQFKQKPTIIVTTIPENYEIGKVIRLKGLGKRIGPFKGDLYIRIFNKNTTPRG